MRRVAWLLFAILLLAACGVRARPPAAPPSPVAAGLSNEAFRVAHVTRDGPRVTVRGQASVFEATFAADVVDGAGSVLVRNTVQAAAAAPAWGDFNTTLTLPADGAATRLTLRLYEPSPKDGTPQHVLNVPLL